MIVQRIQAFFALIEQIWNVIPAYLKVFMYSVSSSTFGLWVAGELSWMTVAIIVATNLGIYQAPRVANTQINRIKN